MEAYFAQELQKTVETINRLNEEHCLAFPILADVHIHPEKPEFMLRYEHTIELMRELNRGCRIDAQFYLGDQLLVTGALPGDYWTEARTSQALEQLRSDLLSCNENSFFVAGNHDGAGAIPARSEDWYRQMIDPNKVCGVEDQGYFYVDFPKHKVRAVCLMDTQQIAGEEYEGYLPDQLQWLADTALQIPADYRVLIFAHVPLWGECRRESQANSDDLIGIFRAFQNREKYEGTVVNADFTDRNEGKICALFGGHDHVQWAGYACDIPFLQIETPSGMIHHAQRSKGWRLPEGFVPVERKMYDETEVLFDTVIFDPKKDLIHVVRFGCGEDMTYDLNANQENL